MPNWISRLTQSPCAGTFTIPFVTQPAEELLTKHNLTTKQQVRWQNNLSMLIRKASSITPEQQVYKNPDQEMQEEVIERPNAVQLSMPWQLYELLQWENNDGLEWSYIDKDRVLIKRIPKEGGPTGDTLPQHLAEQQPDNPETIFTSEEKVSQILEKLKNDPNMSGELVDKDGNAVIQEIEVGEEHTFEVLDEDVSE